MENVQPRRPKIKTPSAPAEREATILAMLLLAGVSGARSALGVSAVSHALSRRSTRPNEQPGRALSNRRVASATAAFAAMELACDKLPGIPNRTDAGPLVGRAVSGAIIGAAIGATPRSDRTLGAMIGAATAVVGAHVSFHARRRLSEAMPPIVAALVEDAALLAIAALAIAVLDPDR